MTILSAAVATDEPPARPAGGRRVLLAPVTITPTKPLTPSHLKGLLWTDVMFRATGRLADVTYRCSHTTYSGCEQTVGFWEYLDRTVGDTDYSGCSDTDIGELYVRYRACEDRAPFAACVPYLDAVERTGWTHPASERVLAAWADQYARLGLHDPGLTAHQPPGLGLDEAIDRLRRLGMCLDLRDSGGPVYVDATEDGIPLRQVVAADGRPNYLACALRELLPLAPDYDEVVLLYDRGLESDYLLLDRVLSRLGVDVRRVPLGRVPIDGRIASARHGGWQDCSAGALLDALGARHDADAVRLAMRLYFVALLGPGDQDSFRHDLLDRCALRATKLLGGAVPTEPAVVLRHLAAQRGDHCYVDPYRLTSRLLGRRREPPWRDLLTEVFT